MTVHHDNTASAGPGQDCDPATRITRSLLGYGVIAGPIYLVVSLVQAATRDGFDITRHEWSLLANGPMGWIQITNLLLTGLMTIAGSVGIHRSLPAGPGSTWGPRLLGLYGAGFATAGVFLADPTDGFPVGTPAGRNTDISWHGGLHLLCASIGFIGLVLAGFAIARWFSSVRQDGWAWYSRITASVFLAAFVGLAVGAGNPALNLCFVGAIVAGSVWISAVCMQLYRREVGPAH